MKIYRFFDGRFLAVAVFLFVFLLGGFFVAASPASANTGTTTNPYYLNGYDLRNVSGKFISDEKFWFDGQYYRYSFTADKDFYTLWQHYGTDIHGSSYYIAGLSVNYRFKSGLGGTSGAYFVDDLSDLSGYKKNDAIFFLWEKGRRYDTYIVENKVAPTGVAPENAFLAWRTKNYPDDRLVAENSNAKFVVRYNMDINNTHPPTYLDYNYSLRPDPVILIPGILGSWEVNGKWEVDPILHTYDNLWEALKQAGYIEGENLFALPYNWRQSNIVTAGQLKDKIQEIKAICKCDKVDLIGHSMGGLVARAYIEGNNYQNDVDQMIFLATPHLGSPDAYLMWEGGSIGTDLWKRMLGLILFSEAKHSGYVFMSHYIRDSVKSVGELLPIYDYLRNKDSMALRLYPNNYPRNVFLEELNQENSLAKLSQVKMYNFLGDFGTSSTVNYLRIVPGDDLLGNWLHGYPEKYDIPFTDRGLEYGSGDITVPRFSNNGFASTSDIVISTDHENIVTDAQKQVIKILTNKDQDNEVRENVIHNFLMVRIFSPANFVIIAPDGKKLGHDFAANSEISEIPGAFYSGTQNSEEFAVISNPIEGEYKIALNGTGDGQYRLSMTYVNDSNTEVTNNYLGEISLNQQQEFNINYSIDNVNILSDLQPQDTVPPTISIISPSSSQLYYRDQKMDINYRIVDNFTGVATTTVRINNNEIITSTINLSTYAVGEYQLLIEAGDKVGNIATSSIEFMVTTDLTHTIADVELFYQQNGITKDSRNKLMAQLEQLEKELKLSDLTIFCAQKAREAITGNVKLKPATKNLLLKEADKGIVRLKAVRQELITAKLNNFDKHLNNILSQGKTSHFIYDILKADSDFLKNNLK